MLAIICFIYIVAIIVQRQVYSALHENQRWVTPVEPIENADLISTAV